MANPGSFSDLGKAAKEALFKEKLLKDFNTKDQINFSNTSTAGVKFAGKVTREEVGKFTGQVELKFPKHKTYGTEGGVTFDTKGKSKLTVSQSDRLVPGLKLSGAVEHVRGGDSVKRDVHLQGEYKREHVNTSFKAIVPVTPSGFSVADTSLEHQVVVGLEEHGLALGVETKYSLGSKQLKSLYVQAQWQRGNGVLLGYSNEIRVPDKGEPSHVCGVMYYLRPTLSALQAVEVAGEVEYNVLSKSDNVTVGLGFGWNPAENVRVQTKFDSRGNGVLVGTHALNANTKVRAGLELGYDTLSLKKNFLELSLFD